jgi:hypothetical protein
VFPIWTINLRAIWLLLLWFGADIVQTLVTRAHMGNDGGTNFVVHAAGFFLGVVVALFARMHGVMRRYEAMPVGHGLFGYWPSGHRGGVPARAAHARGARADRAAAQRAPPGPPAALS